MGQTKLASLHEEGGRQKTKSEETRQRVLDCAARLFRQQGYSVRLTDVAEAAGVKTGSLYYHFDGRDSLVDEVLRISVQVAIDHLEVSLAELPPEATAVDKLTTAIRSLARIALEVSDYGAAENRLFPVITGEMRERQSAREKVLGNRFQELIDAVHEEGQLRPGFDLYTIRALLAGTINSTSEWYRPNREPDVDTIIENLVDMTLHGIQARS